MAALSSSSLLSSSTSISGWDASSSSLFADELSHFALLLQESLCKEPSEIERELTRMEISIMDPSLCHEGFEIINRLFASAIGKIDENTPASSSKFSGKQRENALANIQKIWAKYKEALDEKINNLANNIDLNWQQIRLMNAQIKHASDCIAEINRSRSSPSWIPDILRFGPSFPTDWQSYRDSNIIAEECRKDDEASYNGPVFYMTALSVEAFPRPEMSRALSTITNALQDAVNIKNQVDVLLQEFSDKEKTQTLLEGNYYYLFNLFQAINSQEQLTREYNKRLKEIEGKAIFVKEMTLLTAMFGMSQLLIRAAEDSLNCLKKRFVQDQPRVELGFNYNNSMASILKEVVIYKEMTEVTKRDSSFSEWANNCFKHLKSQWENALRYRERTLKVLFKDIAKLEKQHDEAVSYRAKGQEQINRLFKLTKEDEDSGWVEILSDLTIGTSSNREKRERKS